ncbi:geranylgeranyl reductase family protein [Xylanimonas allomyrinae]|uniref:Geranylgeranyl reductase family protein n=1 Tax=Xylanimonas allomyrinae TaxID=2509459 RepID=A0A4P6EV53_9MICO|nr:geranylgeranyl reductase family protein [Xylanimonas allomyrinae]QAY64347.1 geranylgeranyl reductase family protein [Xylanimonas allomyrinae]
MRAGANDDADVVVVGAGPAGSSTAHWCAAAGLDVLLLEKAAFPRDKVCGDGLTPRAVAELTRMGVDLDPADGWIRNDGLRVLAGRRSWELPWPEVTAFPSYGSAMARAVLDHRLAQHAQRSGAKLLERTKVTGPVQDDRTGRVVGVRAQAADGREVVYRAPVVVAADGVSSRFATALGIARRDDRPLGTAYRTYFRTDGAGTRTARHADTWMESHLELWAGEPGQSALLPGYGWIFALGDGTVNVGLGSVSSTPQRQSAVGHDYRALLAQWIASTPEEWGFTPENQIGPIRGAALPMGFNRSPMYRDGTILVGDAAGMVSPFNGEGIAYALQAGRVAADAIAQARTRTSDAAREAVLGGYAERMRADLGGYYTLGRAFVRLIEHPAIMRFGTRYALPVPAVMSLVLKLLSDCYEPRGGDWVDRLISALTRVVPAA